MQQNTFLRKMTNASWFADRTKIIKADIAIDITAEKRLAKCPNDFIDFITSFKSFTNGEENVWFLSYADYKTNKLEVFPWNEFELQSMKASSGESQDAIKSFWDTHIPFLLSLKGGYSYIAICVDEENYGKIYQGREPEYENVTLIANSLEAFFDKFSQSLITF